LWGALSWNCIGESFGMISGPCQLRFLELCFATFQLQPKRISGQVSPSKFENCPEWGARPVWASKHSAPHNNSTANLYPGIFWHAIIFQCGIDGTFQRILKVVFHASVTFKHIQIVASWRIVFDFVITKLERFRVSTPFRSPTSQSRKPHDQAPSWARPRPFTFHETKNRRRSRLFNISPPKHVDLGGLRFDIICNMAVFSAIWLHSCWAHILQQSYAAGKGTLVGANPNGGIVEEKPANCAPRT